MTHFRALYLIPPLGGASLALGYAGYGRLPDSHFSISDRVFSTLQLFSLNESVPDGGTPWQLDIARFLAPLTLALTAVLAVIALLGREIHEAITARTARGHIVVIASQTDVAVALRRVGWRVLHLSDAIDDMKALAKVRSDRARHVLVLTSDDADNLRLATWLMGSLSRPDVPRSVHVQISSPELWPELVGRASTLGEAGLHYVHPADLAARAMLDLASQLMPAGYEFVAVDGSTPTALRLITHLARRSALGARRLRIELVGPDASEAHRLLAQREPWALLAADVRVGTGGDCGIAFVCCENDTGALARAVHLLERTRGPVLAELHRSLLDATGQLLSPDNRLYLLPPMLAQEAEGVLQGTGLELMARARHEYYLRVEGEKGHTRATNASLVPWVELPKSLRTSNRESSKAAWAVLARLGASLIPLRGPVPSLQLPGEVLDCLAREEHERWMCSLLNDGWTATSGPKDPNTRRHPSLVPWKQLSVEEQKKDSDAVRALPLMLAWLGYELRLPGSEEDGVVA